MGQAITEAEVKAVEEEQEEQLAQAAKYVLQAKEAARDGDIGIAKQLYEDALAVYRELNIWDERMEAVYDAMDALTQGSGQNPGEVQGGSQNGAQQNAAQNAGDGQQSTAQDAGGQDTQAKG